MNYWRMSFRCGNHGYEMWEKCLELGVAGITYFPIVSTDLSKYKHPQEIAGWDKLKSTQKSSIKRFRFEFKKGDIIFTKKGNEIVGKGIITGNYKYTKKTSLVCPNNKIPWNHQIEVKWDEGFIPIKIQVGSQQHTVALLKQAEVKLILTAQKKSKVSDSDRDYFEGGGNRKEITFRKRNRALIEAKKSNSDGSCEICSFNYQEFYHKITKNYLEAHHLNPIHKRKHSEKTKLEEIALVCSNCHRIIHTEEPPIELDRMRKRLNKKKL